jgi:protein-glutamine gamma-glutamyltransferase
VSGAAVSAPGRIGFGSERAATAKVRPEQEPVSLWLELPLFAALGAFAMLQWTRLVEPAPLGREALALGAVCVCALGLRALGRLERGWLRMVLCLLVGAGGVAVALLAAGLPRELLAPAHWGELRDQVRSGIGGIEEADLPYAGDDQWIRLSLVLGAPALVALAGAVAFWPTKRPALNRACALGILLIVYGVGATLDNPGAEVLWGVALLLLACAWLWIARLEPRRRPLAVGVALAAGVLAVPLTARLNAPAWWDYETWSWFGAERTVEFQWNHEYGPLDWPREGTTLMTVDSERPLYWKASVLDRFDGHTWSRAVPGDPSAVAELHARAAVPGSEELDARHPDWVERAAFELRALTSDFVIGAGITRSVDGEGGSLPSADGTLTHVGPPLERGDSYSIVAYVPQPTVEQLRRAPAATDKGLYASSTLIGMPPTVEQPAARTVTMPLWDGGLPKTRAAVLASPYAGTYQLAREWAAGANTQYEAVRSIERHLRGDFNYTPTVPASTYPLASFLFEDRAGYCQQFAGSMALMLRMLGIPSRVVSGFAPGSPLGDEGVYEVRDFDAHSWVEVYFPNIGWVAFDPTPGSAPAESQRLGGEFATALTGSASGAELPQPTEGFRRGAPDAGDGAGLVRDDGPWDTIGLILVAALALSAVVLAVISWRRRRELASGRRADEQVAELAAALRRFGWQVGPRATLLAIEERATGQRRRPVRDYAAALRAHRFGAASQAPPGPEARRAMRRALGEGGLGRRLRALIAIPPGGPASP